MSPLLKHILEALSLDRLREDRFIRPAREVTYLYFQIQRIYPHLSERHARYLSLLIHSEGDRESISEACISSFFQMEEEEPWEKVAKAYAKLRSICLFPLPADVLHSSPLSPLPPQRAINVEKIRQEVVAGSRKFRDKIRHIPEERLKMWCRNYDRETSTGEAGRAP